MLPGHTQKRQFHLCAGDTCQAHPNHGAQKNLGWVQMPANRGTKKDATKPHDSHRGQCHSTQRAQHWAKTALDEIQKVQGKSESLVLREAQRPLHRRDTNMHIGKQCTHHQGGARQDRNWGPFHRTGAVQASSQAFRIYMISIFSSMPETMSNF